MASRNPELGPPVKGFTWSDRIKSVPGTFPVLFVIFIIFFSMYTGTATPTEAGALGSMVVFIMTSHEMDHLGQVAAWRRAAGLGSAS